MLFGVTIPLCASYRNWWCCYGYMLLKLDLKLIKYFLNRKIAPKVSWGNTHEKLTCHWEDDTTTNLHFHRIGIILSQVPPLYDSKDTLGNTKSLARYFKRDAFHSYRPVDEAVSFVEKWFVVVVANVSSQTVQSSWNLAILKRFNNYCTMTYLQTRQMPNKE